MKVPKDKKSPCGHTGGALMWQKPLDTVSIPKFQTKYIRGAKKTFGYSTTVKPNVKIIFTLMPMLGVNYAY